MNREQMIEEAAETMHALPSYGSGLPWALSDKDKWRDRARAALTVFEKAQAPTDEEREVLVRILSTKRMHTNESLGAQRADANAILDAGFRRPAQGEPTNAYVTALASEFEREWNDRFPEFDPEVHDESGFIWEIMRAALRAAFTTGQEDGK